MKTTLKYNTIESFQRQPAWKKFIEIIVDSCNGLYDGFVSAAGECDTDSMSVYTDFDEDNNNPKRLGLYEFVNDRYVLTADETVKQGKTYYKKSFSNDIQPQYPLLDYVNTNTPTILKENISLKGLLHTLSLYGCKIKDIEFYKSFLPHTYKVSRDLENVENIYGLYEQGGVTYDNPVQAIVDGNSGQNVDGIIGNIDIDDDLNYNYTYKENIYGYNQKHPVITKVQLKEVINYHCYKKLTSDDFATQEEYSAFITANPYYEQLPNYIYTNDWNGDTSSLETFLYTKNSDNQYIRRFVTGRPTPHTDEYERIYEQDSSYAKYSKYMVGMFYSNENPYSTCSIKQFTFFKDTIIDNYELRYWWYNWRYLQRCYNYTYYSNTSFPMFVEDSDEDLFIAYDKKINDTERIKFNTYDYVNSLPKTPIGITYYSLTEDLTLYNKFLFRKNQLRIDWFNGNPNSINGYNADGSKTEKYYEYELNDFKKVVVMDETESYFNISLPYLKNQLFSEECTLKVQPLFEYNDWRGTPFPIKMVSMCANTIDSSIQGGVGEITYEIEKYEKFKISTKIETKNNATDWTANNYVNKIVGTYQGNYFYKWEQFGINGYIQDVYTLLKFDELKGDYESNANYNYFFNGYNVVFPITDEDYTNNSKKVIDGYTYVNTYQLEYFETMYFNHFVKISPIGGEKEGNTIKTTTLYCDNLELVKFGDIVPYIVTYDRIGKKEIINGVESDIYDDIDCSIFSKILCYNKRTHLITVDEPVYFKYYNEGEDKCPSKYAVVAYQNNSPFNKISSMNIVAPDSVKNVVAGLLNNYKNDYKYELNLFTEAEYQEYLESLQS
jgi:hypothetical protein